MIAMKMMSSDEVMVLVFTTGVEYYYEIFGRVSNFL
jgi:hypothetical protein